MNCLEPINKKEFGIDVYEKLNTLYGQKDYYDVVEIQTAIEGLEYPKAYSCWALVAFMLPANVGEYFRTKGTPLNILEMKRELILAMTDGERNSLNLPKGVKSMYDIEIEELTQMNLVNIVSIYTGYRLGRDIVNGMIEI